MSFEKISYLILIFDSTNNLTFLCKTGLIDDLCNNVQGSLPWIADAYLQLVFTLFKRYLHNLAYIPDVIWKDKQFNFEIWFNKVFGPFV